MEKFKMNFILVDRNTSKNLIKYLDKLGFTKHYSFYGKGSASSKILDYLGIGETEKNILLYPAGEEKSIMLMNYIKESEFLKTTIAFRVAIKGISSSKALDYFLKEE